MKIETAIKYLYKQYEKAKAMEYIKNPHSPIHCPDGSNCFVWRYKDEAEKLIES